MRQVCSSSLRDSFGSFGQPIENRQGRLVLNRPDLVALGGSQLQRVDHARIVEGTNELLLQRDLPQTFQLRRA